MVPTSPSLLEQLRLSASGTAWDRFVFLYSPLLFRWANRLGVTGSDADDLVQDVFTTLVGQLPGFQYNPAKRFRGWLWTVLANKVRERRRRLTIATTSLDVDELPDPTSSDPADEIIEQEYQTILVRQALELIRAEFPPATWLAFWESVTTDRPAAEIAARSGLSVGAIYQLKSRILRRLRRDLEGLMN